MVSDILYELCLPILDDPAVDEEERAERLEKIIETESSLSGKPLEEAVLGILWRHRESKVASKHSPSLRHATLHSSSRPWRIAMPRSPLPRSPLASPSISGAAPPISSALGARPSNFKRSPSYGATQASPFGSPHASPRIAFATPIPHSPSLSSYEFSDPIAAHNDYGDIGSDTVDWLVSEEPNSRPSSSGAGSAYESGLSGAAAAWTQPQQNEMSPYDMLRSVLGGGKTDEEIESALEANGYDLSTTLMSLMGGQASYSEQQSMTYQPENQILIGKSMVPSQTLVMDQRAEKPRSSIVCKYWLSNGNCLRADCRFSHDLSNHICKYVLSCLCSGVPCCYTDCPDIGLWAIASQAMLVSSPMIRHTLSTGSILTTEAL